MASKETIRLLQQQIDLITSGSDATSFEPDVHTDHSSHASASCAPLINDARCQISIETDVANAHEPDNHPSTGGEVNQSEKAFKKVVAILNAGDKSEKALRKRLRDTGFSDDEIEQAITRALDYGFIDDMRFADVLVRSRISQGKGCAGIERELRENDIDPAMVPGWPFEFGIDDDSETSRALDLLRRKPPRAKNLRDAAFRKLVQKGFSVSIASTAARAWFEDQQAHN